MLFDMSPLLRPSLIGFLVNQPLSAMLLHMDLLATIMTFNGLVILGDILSAALSCVLILFTFAL
jgi:hypothetical protein